MSGTGNREPRDVGGAGGVGGAGRRGRFRLACDEAVAPFSVVADASLAHQRSHDGADGVVPGGGAFADLALRERRIGFGERLEDSPLGGVGLRRGLGGVARAQDARTLCALEIPARLWRALGEAGPRPHPAEALDLSDRWWLVEVEHPRDEEPNTIALWEEDGAEVVLAAFLCDDDGGGVSFPTVVTWRTTSEGERSEVGVAVLKGLIKANDPESPENRVGTIQIIDALAAPDSGAIARAKTAIAMHLENDGRATPLASYRASTGSTSTQRQEVSTGRRSITALFAIERAPEPEPAEEHPTGEGHRPGGRGRLRERHHVRAHWKRQAYGPKRSKRRWKVIEGYTRGPEPEEDQIAMTRLAEGQLQARDDDPRTCEGRKGHRRESMGSGKGPWQQEPKA